MVITSTQPICNLAHLHHYTYLQLHPHLIPLLRHVDVGSNYSRNPGAFAWAQVIESNNTLTRLCLVCHI